MSENNALRRIADATYVPKTIVCPLDLSDEENVAGLHAALSLAEHIDATLHVINVLRSPTPPPVRPGQRILPDLDQQWKESRAASEGKLAGLIDAERGARDVDVRQHVAVGIDYREIAAYAEEVDADLIVMVSRGRHGLTQKLLGSVAERVIRLADCPVLTVPPDSGDFAPRNIVVASDFSACSDQALPAVSFLRRAFGARLLLTHVLPPQSRPAALSETGPPPMMTDEFMSHLREAAKRDLEERVEALAADGIDVELTEAGDPGAEIVAVADRENADLIVVGTRGNSGVQRLMLGSTAEKIVRRSDHPVLTVTPGAVLAEPTALRHAAAGASG